MCFLTNALKIVQNIGRVIDQSVSLPISRQGLLLSLQGKG